MPTLKRKEPPPLQEQQPNLTPPKDIPGQALSEDRIVRINPEVDARLTAFMKGNSKATEYYTKLVKENPTHAVRTIMLPKMFRFEAEQRMEKVGLVALFEKNRKIWVEVSQKSYSFVRDGFPPGSIIRRDDVQKTLIPILEVHEDLRDYLDTQKLRGKF